MASKRPTTFSMRMPEDLNLKIQAYATEHGCTKAEAMSHFARAGIELEEGGAAAMPEQPSVAQQTGEVSSSTVDAESLAAQQETLKSIDERLAALQSLPTIEPEPGSAIVPIDIRDKIQAYSAEHECSEQEALTYYARIGIQLSGDTRAATAADMAELARRIDLLAQDSQAKNEQLRVMAEAITAIHEYTKPDELELEGELGEPDAEDVPEEPELTDEERQRIADEHTRQVVSDVMGDYLKRQQEADAEFLAQQNASDQSLNPWIPVLVAIIVSLVIGLVLVLTR